MTLPLGYSTIPGGTFTPHGTQAPVTVAPFGMKRTPVTNAEYGALAQSLGADRFVLLDHNWESGVTQLVRRGRTAEATAGGPMSTPEELDFDLGDVLLFGSQILVKMVDNPSAQCDEADRLFSGATQPAVGLTYFHAKAWCLLKSLEVEGAYRVDGAYRYDLPTDEQYKYVSSDGGTKEYGTKTGTLYDEDGRKLAHIGECEGTTVVVNDSRYEQDLPFGVQTTGNVWRWIQMNPALETGNYFWGPYGLRGGSWNVHAVLGRAAFRDDGHPADCADYVGFSPVVVRQDS